MIQAGKLILTSFSYACCLMQRLIWALQRMVPSQTQVTGINCSDHSTKCSKQEKPVLRIFSVKGLATCSYRYPWNGDAHSVLWLQCLLATHECNSLLADDITGIKVCLLSTMFPEISEKPHKAIPPWGRLVCDVWNAITRWLSTKLNNGGPLDFIVRGLLIAYLFSVVTCK